MISVRVNIVDENIIKDFTIDERITYSDFFEIVDAYVDKFDLSILHLYLMIACKEETPIWDARIVDVLRANSLNDETVVFHAQLGGIGGGESLDASLKIEIRQAEPQHRYTPHVHVSNDKGRHTVSIKIEDGSILAGQKYWDTFKNKDKKEILKLIRDYNEEFIAFYNKQALQLLVPNPIKFVFRGRVHCLSYGKSENLSVTSDEKSLDE